MIFSGINLDLGIAKDMFMINMGGGAGQIGILILTLVATLAITRNTRHIALTLFPIMLGFSRIGMGINRMWLIGSGVIWAVTLLGSTTIGSSLMSVASAPFRLIEARRTTRIQEYGIKGAQRYKDYLKAGFKNKDAYNNSIIDLSSDLRKKQQKYTNKFFERGQAASLVANATGLTKEEKQFARKNKLQTYDRKPIGTLGKLNEYYLNEKTPTGKIIPYGKKIGESFSLPKISNKFNSTNKTSKTGSPIKTFKGIIPQDTGWIDMRKLGLSSEENKLLKKLKKK